MFLLGCWPAIRENRLTAPSVPAGKATMPECLGLLQVCSLQVGSGPGAHFSELVTKTLRIYSAE